MDPPFRNQIHLVLPDCDQVPELEFGASCRRFGLDDPGPPGGMRTTGFAGRVSIALHPQGGLLAAERIVDAIARKPSHD